MMTKQAILLLAAATGLALLVNLISPNSIEVIGTHREISSGDGPIVPPAAEVGDAPFIDINRAEIEFTEGVALFVDARETEEFECSTIPGSINIPFEYMPEGDLAIYFDSSLGGAPSDQAIIVFCSGEECDLSLHLTRNLSDYGYTGTMIFFGGAREWEAAGLDLERRVNCDE